MFRRRCHIYTKFRKDNTHYKSEDEKRIYDKLNYDRMKSEMEVLKIRRDNFSNELKQEDTDNKKYFENNMPDKDVLEGVLEIWNKSIKRDEEQVQEKWVHKIESMKKDFQRTKNFVKERNMHKENNYNMNTTETKEQRNPNEKNWNRQT